MNQIKERYRPLRNTTPWSLKLTTPTTKQSDKMEPLKTNRVKNPGKYLKKKKPKTLSTRTKNGKQGHFQELKSFHKTRFVNQALTESETSQTTTKEETDSNKNRNQTTQAKSDKHYEVAIGLKEKAIPTTTSSKSFL